MIKLTFALRRKPDMSRESFQAYWRGTHADLVADRADVLKIRRYVQVHTSTELDGLHRAFQARNDDCGEPYDGVAELWFDSLDALGGDDEAVRTAQAELLTDERNFIDLANSPMWIAVEHEIVALH